MSDMKKRLEAFKAAKSIDKTLKDKISKKVKETSPDIIEVNDNRSFRWDNTEALEERAMTPLDQRTAAQICKRAFMCHSEPHVYTHCWAVGTGA